MVFHMGVLGVIICLVTPNTIMFSSTATANVDTRERRI